MIENDPKVVKLLEQVNKMVAPDWRVRPTLARLPMWIAGIAYWVIGFPICVMLGFWTDMQGQGVWAGLAFALLVAAALMTWRFEWLTRKHRLGADA